MLKKGRAVSPGAKLRGEMPIEMDIEASRGGPWEDTGLESGLENHLSHGDKAYKDVTTRKQFSTLPPHS